MQAGCDEMSDQSDELHDSQVKLHPPFARKIGPIDFFDENVRVRNFFIIFG